MPAFLVAGFFLVFSWLGGWQWVWAQQSTVLVWFVRLMFAGTFVCSLAYVRHYRLPERDAVVRRIENASKLDNRPLTAQNDPLAMGGDDALAKALWQEHRVRMAGKMQHLTSGSPKPAANRFDPFAVRAMLPLLAFAAFCYSFSPGGGRVADAYALRGTGIDAASRIDAWINPPAYTRKPPIYLTLAQETDRAISVNAPVGSEFFLRFVGKDEVTLTAAGDDTSNVIERENSDLEKSDSEFRFTLEQDTVVALQRGEEMISQWGISLSPDQAPKISFVEEPSAALSGSMQLTYQVEDDYGVVRARPIIRTREKVAKDARPLVDAPEFDLPLPRLRARKGVSKLNKDVTEHPWAGSRVTLHLEAEDDRAQIGRSETIEFELPGRRFSNPIAAAIIEQRRILAMDANQQRYVANLLDAVSRGPEEFMNDATAIIAMRAAYRRLVDARTDDQLRSTLDLMWDIALGMEFGDLTDAERRLRDAQERLSEALENGASDEEIDRLMDELRQAMNEMLQALAEQARNNPQTQNPFEQNNAQRLTQNDLERMMEQIENLAKSGSKDAARQLLSEMQRMMDNLRAGRHEQQRQAEGNQLNQTLDKLSELMQQQQQLMNETYRMQRQQENLQQGQQQQQRQQQRGQQRQGERQQGQQQQGQQHGQQGERGQQGEMSPEELAQALEQLRQQQEALQQELGELGQQLEELGLGQPQELGEAQNEMGQAAGKLGEGDTGGAGTDQGQALEALRRGAQNMMQQMAGDRQQGGQQQAEENGQGQAGQRRGTDPLGRQEQEGGLDANSDVKIPGEIDAQRARRILEAIRKRLSIPDNPVIEKDYLERLLRSE